MHYLVYIRYLWHQVCSSQIASSLQFTNCIKPAVHNFHQVCSSQLASSLQFTTCSKSVDNLQQTWYYQAGASDANASWYRLDDRKLHQVCSRPAATCEFLAVYILPTLLCSLQRYYPDIPIIWDICLSPFCYVLHYILFIKFISAFLISRICMTG
jgi:hypothetical protein